MKNLIILIGILALMWGGQALAAKKPLTDRQLDAVTAGSVGDSSIVALSADNVQQSINANVANQVDASAQNDLNFGDPNALNVVNNPTVNVNNSVDASQNVNSKNQFIVLQDYVQENAKAEIIQNVVDSQVANALNMHVNGFRPDVLSGGSSGGSLNNLYQTNIINQNRN